MINFADFAIRDIVPVNLNALVVFQKMRGNESTGFESVGSQNMVKRIDRRSLPVRSCHMINRYTFLKNYGKRIRNTTETEFYPAATLVKLLQEIVLIVN